MLKFKPAKMISKVINSNKMTRNLLLKVFDAYIYNEIVRKNEIKVPTKVAKQKYYATRALISSFLRNLDKGHINKRVSNRMVETFADQVFCKVNMGKDRFKKNFGFEPPMFITLSPYAGCNLKCSGCYANSESKKKGVLPYETVSRIVREVHELWDSNFVVISGGEPLMYKDNGKTILDLFEEHPHMFFLVFTNGTLITETLAARLERLGNVTLSVSIEGFEKETDIRRGKGIYAMLFTKFKLLRESGVPFGISVTATRKNAALLSKKGFYDHCFQEIGASYMWMFQYMPIGRGFDTKLMVTPRQRLALYRRWEKEIIESQYFIADFWNSGMLCEGCIAYGRPIKGYLYIDWNGNIMPCVFIPYYVDNIKELYKDGKTLNDALFSEFFKKGRAWQQKYAEGMGNWLRPCSIRDHYEIFRDEITPKNVLYGDEGARQAHHSKKYYSSMAKYDKEYENLTRKIWEEEFLEQKKKA